MNDANAPETEEGPKEITYDDFARVELRVAEVLTAEKVKKADKLLKLTIRVGEEERTLVAGVAEHYTPEELVGKKIIVVANLKPAKIRGVKSQGMLLAAEGPDGKLSVVTLDRDLPGGSKVR